MIVIVFDISEKIDDFLENELTLKSIIVEYYFNFIPFLEIYLVHYLSLFQ